MNGIGPYTELNRPSENGGRTALGDIIALVPDEMAEGAQSFDQMLQGNQDQPKDIQSALPEASQSTIAPDRLPEELASIDIGSQVKETVAEGQSGEDNPSVPTGEASVGEAGLQGLPLSNDVTVSANDPTQPDPQNDPIAALPSMTAPVAAESAIVQGEGQPASVTAHIGAPGAEQVQMEVGSSGAETDAAIQQFIERAVQSLQVPSLKIEGDTPKWAASKTAIPPFLNVNTPDTPQTVTHLGYQPPSNGSVALPEVDVHELTGLEALRLPAIHQKGDAKQNIVDAVSLSVTEMPSEHDILANKAIVKKVITPDAEAVVTPEGETKRQRQAKLMALEQLIPAKPQEVPLEAVSSGEGLATRPIAPRRPVIFPEIGQLNRLPASEGFSGSVDVQASPETFVLKFNPDGAEQPVASGARLDEAKGAGGLVQPLSAKLELTSLEQSTAKPTQEPPHPNAQASVLRATMALNMRDTQWGQKLVAQIEKMQNEGVARYDISLRPKNLGDLQVSLEFRGEDTHVRIVTETTSASRVLIGAEDRLAQMLDNAGFRLTSFAASMSAGQQSAGTGLGQNAKQKQNSAELANKNKGARNASASSPVASAETKSHNGAVNVIA